MNIDHPYILDVLYSYYFFSNQGKTVNFWILSNICIHGNNEAGEAAKSTLDFEIVNFKIFLSTGLKHFIKFYINYLWQIFWDFCDTSKLFKTKWRLKRTKLSFQEFVFFTLSQLKGTATWVHIWWLSFDLIWYIWSVPTPNVQSMRDLFTGVNINDFLKFLQECDFYNQIFKDFSL